MRLKAITIQRYRNFVNPQRIEIEDDVTSLVGKNESGKTTILKALHRLKPANGSDVSFDLTTEYPRWRLARDRRDNPNLASEIRPIHAEYSLDEADLEAVGAAFGFPVPASTTVHQSKTYTNKRATSARAELADLIASALDAAEVDPADRDQLQDATSLEDAQTKAKDLAKSLKDAGNGPRSKAVAAFAATILDRAPLVNGSSTAEQGTALAALTPSYFYFSNYSILPGQSDLTVLNQRIAASEELSDEERTVVALLAHANETPEDFLDANYDSRKAELQAASFDLSQRAFEYWKQNDDLEVIFDTDNVVADHDGNGVPTPHRILKIELRDARHGNVETNFSTRSTGFQWFFSFFAAFAEYQDSSDSVIVLLDEPGTSLHGEAQKDFLRFIYEELGASKQTIYTTHSQHMVDPARYEKIRAVHDRATRQDPDRGVVVTLADFSTDRDTILPLEAALGYTISQHLFLGSGQHLAVEGSSDFVYLQRLSEHLLTQSKTPLDSRLSIIPVGGADNMPVFVALLGRRLKVSALIDGAATNSKVDRTKRAAAHNNVDESHVVAVGELDGLPANADIEDLFAVEDYLKLYNWAFGTSVKAADLPATNEPILRRLETVRGEKFDHALVAHAMTDHRDEFFASLKPASVSNFEKLFVRLNGTVE